MKKIHFHSVKIKNFLSVGNEFLEISFKKGINLITGENKDKGGKNGIGKSTILEAIYWGLFGSTIRDIKKDKIIHNLSKKDCNVEIVFSVINQEKETKYKIIRSLEPSKIQIFCNDEDITHSTIVENDSFIKGVLNGSEELFQNAIIMSANNTLPFMAQKKTDKRKFIEGILNLNIFSDILLKARADYNDYKKQNDISSNSFVEKQKTLEAFENQKIKNTEEKKKKIEELEEKIKITKKEIEILKNNKTHDSSALETEIKEFESKIESLETFSTSINKVLNNITSESAKISAEIKQLTKEKQSFTDKGNMCPTCNREYSKNVLDDIKNKIIDIDKSTKKFNEKILNLLDDKTSNENKIKDINDGIKKLREKIKECNKKQTETKTQEQKILNLENNIKEYQSWIADYQKPNKNFDDDIEKTKKEILEVEDKLKSIKKHLSVLDTVKFVVSEEGVKTYIVKKLLDLLNNKLNHYLQLLDTPCKCEFNEFFEETIYNEQGKECSYFNFSGGERKRIDIAILFMFQDLLKLQAKTSYSLNIYDEMIDSALDQKGTDKVIEILKDRVNNYDESIYIVSHKSSDMANIDNIILLEKENGITKLIN